MPPSAAARSAPAATTPPVGATTPPDPATTPPAPENAVRPRHRTVTPGSTPSPPPADRGSAPSAPAASVQRGIERRPRVARTVAGGLVSCAVTVARLVRRRRQRARRPGPCCGGRAAAQPRSERTDLACNEPRGPPSIPAPPTPSPARGSRPARTFARRLADAVRRGRGRSEPAAELPAAGVGSSTGTAPQRPAATSAIELARRPSISAPRDSQSLGDEAAAPPSSAPAAEVEEPATERSSAGTTPASPVQRARETSTDSSPEPVAGAGQPAASDADRAAPAPAGGTAPDPTPRSAPSTAPDPGRQAPMRLSRVKRGSAARTAEMPTTRPAAQPPPPGESPSVAGSAGERAQPAGGAGVAVVSTATGGAPTAAPTRAAPAEPGATPPAGLGHTQPGVSDAGPRPTHPAGATTAAPSRAARAGSAQPGPATGSARPRPFIKRRAGAEPMPAARLARDSALQRDQQVAPPLRPPESATPARLSAVATPARRSDRSAAPTSQTQRPVATLARRSVGEPSPAEIGRHTATAVARDDIGRAGRSRPNQLLRRIADALSGRGSEGTPAPAAPASGDTPQSAPPQAVPTATPAPGRPTGPVPAPSPRPAVALAPRREPRGERPLARRRAPGRAPSSESWRSRGADAGLAGAGAARPAEDRSVSPPAAPATHVEPAHDVPLTIVRQPAPAARHDSSLDSKARAAALRSLTRVAAAPPPRSPSQAPPPVRPSRSRLLARAPATGADQGGGGGGGGSGGGGGGGGQDSDLIYTEVMRRVRHEQEQLGQLIDHPF